MSNEGKVAVPGFTKVRGGKNYLVEEVDTYIETLQKVYSDLCEEEEGCRRQLKQEREISFRDKQKLEQELKTREAELAEVKNSLKETMEELEEKQMVSEGASEEISEKLHKQEELLEEKEEELRVQQEVLLKRESEKAELLADLDRKDAEIASANEQLVSYQNRVLDLERKLKEKEDEVVLVKDPRAEEIISLVERASEMTEAYVEDVQAEMDSRNKTSKEEAEKLMTEAKGQALTLIQDAREKAKSAEEEASARVSQILSAAKEELMEIRGLINKASKDYAKLTEENLESEVVFDEHR